uniref:Secreted protein n=1 Tax=Amazona collaria TaxID=241587 RepID=A0A8B9IYQ4_9PSIT
MGKAEVQNLVIVLLQGLHFHTGDGIIDPVPPRPRTWVPGHLPGDAVVAVEELLPQELVTGHGAPLLAHQPHREHVRVVQVQEDLVEDTVGEQRTAARGHRGILPPRPIP